MFTDPEHPLTTTVASALGELYNGKPIMAMRSLRAEVIDPCEKALLVFAMKRLRNNQIHVSKALGINRNTLRKRLAKHGMMVGFAGGPMAEDF